MTTPERPNLWWQVAFSADPNDPSAMRRWTDLSEMVQRVRQMARGRQYELAKSQAGQPSMLFLDPSEYLNPANTSSPYYPDVQPLREILGQAMWPNGGTGNLINANMWMPNDVEPLDPSFESYADGAAAPSTITAVGGVTPTVTTTNPQQGTKSLTYAVAATATRQGVSWEVPCVPGQSYTTSAYVRQTTGSTQQLLVGGQNIMWDKPDRAASNGWDTPDSGGTAWTVTGGAVSDYGAVPGEARQSNNTTNVRRFSVLPVSCEDQSLTARVTIPAVMTGAVGKAGLIVRRIDANNYFYCVIGFNTDGTIVFELDKVLAGAASAIAVVTMPFGYEAGSAFRVWLEVEGGTLRGKLWRDGHNPPADWTLTTTDTTITGPGGMGCHSRLDSGNTNGTVVFVFDDFEMVGSEVSSTTTTTGSYVRLEKTFTASQPTHTVALCTRGTALAGTVNVDAIQHEPGASSSAFTTDGPNVFPLMRDNVERWPRSNQPDTAGFAGQCDTTAVDGFGALNAITLDPDYVAAVMATEPTYLWRLDSGSGSSTALETSGNSGPPLTPLNSKYGPGNPVEFGSPIEIAGAYGGTGAKFTPVDNTVGNHEDTILGVGRTIGSPKIAFPPVFGSTWAVSMAAWVKCLPTDPASDMVIGGPLAPVGDIPQVPVLLSITSTGEAIGALQGPSATSAAISPGVVDDGTPHLLVATVTQASGGNTVVSLYVDGDLVDTDTQTTAFVGAFATPCTALNLGGSGINGGRVVNGVIAHVALWTRALSADEITDLWTAGGLGHAGELSGTRLARRLAQGGYAGETRISAGSTTMQPSTTPTNDALTDAQNTTAAEDGALWVAPDGAVVMEGRQQRWLRLTPRGVFGEDEDNGEVPYMDGVIFDFDPSFVAANVKVARVNGTTAIGGTAAEIASVGRRFFPRASPPNNSDFETDQQAQDAADWTFATHKAPLLRVSVITVDLGSNPSLATKVLGIEVGQRWTVKRRAKAANAGAGITMSADYFIEAVRHNEIDLQTGRWTVSFLMSPIGSATEDPGVTFQPWILEDATLGVLDSTTVLGW